ncbi:leucine-rich repeat-containing protein kinase family protein [Oceaniserpentilla sp. 4NH20-0058]|uniref:protein kinase n=1 Tax=Oceaniserpentilla sp. 4NH20-0058 TaxID=3127660 RepID=UPI0031085428
MFSLSNIEHQLASDDYLSNKRIKLSDDLTEFPQEIFQRASDVEILDLGNNQLTDLPDNFSDLKNLRILFLTNNHFEHIPKVLSQCESLEMIAFKTNRLKKLDEHCLPKSTRWLILTENKIESLPNSMGELTQLKKLALAGNQLRALPKSMQSCTELELVRLSANQLSEIPNWLLRLPKLSWLGFSGNPISQPISTVTNIPASNMDRLTLHHQIGEGASGIIHQGHCHDADQLVAVKLFKGDVTSDGYPKDEVHCCLKTGYHPNLIKAISKVEEPNQLGLVMELIPQGYGNLGLPPSLETCTRDTFPDKTEFTSTEILNIAKQMVSTLSQMHENQVSHGDVYAHNIMIDKQANILFGDFGAATDLSKLNDGQRQCMQAVEVRALGCLMDDLLSLCEQDDLYHALSSTTALCMSSEMTQRPNLADLNEVLAAM